MQPLVIPPALSRINASMVKLSSAVEGSGSFAKVVRATLTEPGKPPKEVAVKVMNRIRALSSSFVNLQNEVSICASLQHPCIINTLASWEDDENIYIVMDLAEKGELYKYCKETGLEDMPIIAPNFIAEVVLGLEYMASKGVVHRDIKPENLLLTSGYHVKIADFGTVCRVDDEASNTFTGTPTFVSPEMLTTSRASMTSDVWALGCVLFHLFVGRSPFQADTEFLTIEAVKCRKFEFPPYFPADARDLVDRMLEMDPAKRIGANGYSDIKRHPFFRNVDWASLLTNSNETFLNQNFTQLYETHLLPGKEKVIFAGMVTKRRYRGMSCKERVLVLTDYPQLFYLDPENKSSKKGFVPWDKDLCAQADSPTEFHCYTSGSRVYHFEEKSGRAHLWAAKINHLVRTKRR
jgi:serine/threonine protein kinase